ncbi:non-homologous end joining protein Ku [Mangrovibrevibacter kandeliae]|uniref:non-homologous end joining protein Ku n=1 Tax=Mangrovibrevibacter kandeliae TaxID=2968473 RepID=UPI00211889B7|nr:MULTISPECIES: Ku protein [unclassified Aurantimonas]MCQ8781121.1 Ku protein [Aurantimonas sp. CSK15Z-1]MCW4113901.1 Ku protein [Aurantimonas sp. MSK8Z-1]
MAPRPVWKGQIRLSLVSIPVEMYSATSSGSAISFRQIDRNSGKRIHYEKVVPGIGPIDAKDIVKGYEYAKDEYVILTDDEIDAVKLDTKKTLELIQFVDSCAIPPLYFDKPYYIVPQDELAEDAFRVVRDALRQAGKTGIGQLALRGKEYLVAVRPCGTGLLLETLHYEEEIRKSDSVFSEISADEAEEDLLAVASELIKRKTGPFDASVYKDHYIDSLKALIAEKRKNGGKAKLHVDDEDDAPPRKTSNVVDLMASLKRSLETDRSVKGKAADAKASDGTPAADGKTAAKSTSTKRRAPAKKPAEKPAPAAKTAAARKRKSA